MCAWPVCIDENNKWVLPGFSYYVGPIWSSSACNTPNHRTLSLRTAVYEGFIELFEKRFERVVASLPLGVDDVRVFDWWNYHSKDKNRIKIIPRYTAILENLAPDTIVEAGYRELRRREIRRSAKNEYYYIDSAADLDEIFHLYQQTFRRQGVDVAFDVKAEIHKLLILANQGFGSLTCIRTSSSEAGLVCIALTLSAKGVSNLVLNLVSDDFRDSGVSAFCTHQAIKKSIESGDTAFDFNGANSPLRGDDKHSYGARAALYFDIKYGTAA